MEPKKMRKLRARSGGLRQQRIITNDVREVVTSITVITASPAYICHETCVSCQTTYFEDQNLLILNPFLKVTRETKG